MKFACELIVLKLYKRCFLRLICYIKMNQLVFIIYNIFMVLKEEKEMCSLDYDASGWRNRHLRASQLKNYVWYVTIVTSNKQVMYSIDTMCGVADWPELCRRTDPLLKSRDYEWCYFFINGIPARVGTSLTRLSLLWLGVNTTKCTRSLTGTHLRTQLECFMLGWLA